MVSVVPLRTAPGISRKFPSLGTNTLPLSVKSEIQPPALLEFNLIPIGPPKVARVVCDIPFDTFRSIDFAAIPELDVPSHNSIAS